MTSLKTVRSFMIAAALALPVAMAPFAQAQIGVSVNIGIAPPALPVYAQPEIPGDGYLWTPGYWGYGDEGYYWVPGVWVQPPSVGVLWTPAYWGWDGGYYHFHDGYWGPHVGFYGGINYGFGYGGVGFLGGEWRGGGFFYNRAVVNFGGVHVTNVYEHPMPVYAHNNVAFNGGPGGIQAHASPGEMQAMHENHIQPTGEQMQHQTFAAHDRGQLASVNHGNPTVRAAATPGSFRANPTNPSAAAHGVSGREANQDQRISNGLRSGQMTSGEAARSEKTQSNIDQQVHNDRTANGGTLTGAERQQVNGEQNAASRQISNEKHNGNTVAPNAVDNREANQQQRTANGIRSGQMTSGEAARTNGNQSNTSQAVHNDRTANGGALNKQQKQQVNKQQNQNSKQIHTEDHNDKKR